MMHGKRDKKKQKRKQKREQKQVEICYPNLPHEIVAEIISWLPVKSLKRLSCLCKSWRDLIKNPSFIKLLLKHASTQNNHVSFMLRCAEETLLSIDYNGVRYGKFVKLDFPFNIGDSSPELLGSCNGLFCFRIEDSETGIHNCLWNPSTREYKEFPNACSESDSQKFGFVSYDEEHNDVSYGWHFDKLAYAFGYNSVIDDYNIVRVEAVGDRDSPSYTVHVYTLGSNSWRRVGDIPYVLSSLKSSGVIVNEAIHWEVNRDSNTFQRSNKFVVALDLVDDKYKEVPLPDGFDNRFGFKVAALGGCFCLINYGNPLNDSEHEDEEDDWSG